MVRHTTHIMGYHNKTQFNHLDHKGTLRKYVLQLISISGTLSALVELVPVSFPAMPLDLACFLALAVTMKRYEDEAEDGDKHEDEDGDLSCTTVLLLVSIADEEGGQDEAPAIPGICRHHNYWFNLHHSQNHIQPHHHLRGAPLNIC